VNRHGRHGRYEQSRITVRKEPRSAPRIGGHYNGAVLHSTAPSLASLKFDKSVGSKRAVSRSISLNLIQVMVFSPSIGAKYTDRSSIHAIAKVSIAPRTKTVASAVPLGRVPKRIRSSGRQTK
jgi:hypothetical protein